MTTTVIKLGTIADALQTQDQEMKAYLNRQTGEVVIVSNDDLTMAEGGTELEGLADWQEEGVRTALDILEHDAYIQLPDQYQIHEWSIMRDFCDEVKDQRLRDELLDSIHGRGAFRQFKNTLHRHGIEKKWYHFRDEAFLQVARDWLEEHEIPYLEIDGSEPKKKQDEELEAGDDLVPPEHPVIAPKLRSIDHVQLAMPANEEEKARAFYVGVLGLSEVPKPANLAKRGGIWFECGNVNVHLAVDEAFQPAKKAHLAFRVEGWEGLIARCQAAGYPVIPDDQIPGVRRVYVFDPFGNRIELIELS